MMKSAVLFKNIFFIVVFMAVLCIFISGQARAQRPIIHQAEAVVTHNAEEGERTITVITHDAREGEEIIIEPLPVDEEERVPNSAVIGFEPVVISHTDMPLIDSAVIGLDTAVTISEPLSRPTVPLPYITTQSIEAPWSRDGYTTEPLPRPITPLPYITSPSIDTPWSLNGYTTYDPTVAFSAPTGARTIFRLNNFNNYSFTNAFAFNKPLAPSLWDWQASSVSQNRIQNNFFNNLNKSFSTTTNFNFFDKFTDLKPIDTIVIQPPKTIPQGNLDPQAGDQNLTQGTVKVTGTDVLLLESYPVQARLNIQGQLPTPCHELRAIVNEPDSENTIQIKLYAVVDPGIICIQALEFFEVTVALGNYTDGVYALVINGEKLNYFDLDNPYPDTPNQVIDADVTVYEDNYGEAVTLSIHESVSIILPSNITTGFQWVLNTDQLDSRVISLVDSQYLTEPIDPDEPIVGAGGNEQFIFQATGEGTTIIQLQYMRPWSQVVEDTFEIEVTVESAHVGGGQIGLANPASVYCIENGGTLEFRNDEYGTYGVCVFSDGTECEEWDFFRGECSQ
ncbi:MAG: protease inhibitor I42 family protein [bacterium]